MSNEHANAIADLFELTTTATVAAANKIPEDRRMTQAESGKAHPTWQLGHMAVVTGHVAIGMCLAKTSSLPAEYGRHFAPQALGGKPIESNADAYPQWDEVLATYKTVAKEVAAAIRELDDSELPGPLKGEVPEPLKERFNVLGTTLNAMAIHNGYHTGQMNLLASLTENVPAN